MGNWSRFHVTWPSTGDIFLTKISVSQGLAWLKITWRIYQNIQFWVPPPQCQFSRSRRTIRICISNQFPSDADPAGSGTTLWELLIRIISKEEENKGAWDRLFWTSSGCMISLSRSTDQGINRKPGCGDSMKTLSLFIKKLNNKVTDTDHEMGDPNLGIVHLERMLGGILPRKSIGFE